MLKENKDFFLYILGIIVLFVLTIFVLDYVNPGNLQEGECGLWGFKCWTDRIIGVEKVYSKAPKITIDTTKDYQATVKTNYGEFVIDLYEKNAPIAVNNFIFLARDDYYDGVKFHRVIHSFLVQGGDRNTLDSNEENDGQGGPGYTFKDEINWNSLDFSNAKRQQLKNLGFSSNDKVVSKHLVYKSVAMANSGPNSNGSQFFIITAVSNDPAVKTLEGQHTVFGKVIGGWKTIEAIENVEVDDPLSKSPKPLEEIVISDIIISES